MKKKLKEIRLSIWRVSENDRGRIGYFTRAISWHYLNEIGDYELEDTVILLITAWEKSASPEKQIVFGLGSKKNCYIGDTTMFFDLVFFLGLNDYKKRIYFLDLIHETCVNFVTHYGYPLEPLQNAYNKVKTSDYFIDHTDKRILSKNRKFELFVDLKVDFYQEEYRLTVINRKDNNKKMYEICKKDILIAKEHPELTINDLLQIPRALKLDGWINENEYQMSWGKEKYIYNIISEQIDLRIDK